MRLPLIFKSDRPGRSRRAKPGLIAGMALMLPAAILGGSEPGRPTVGGGSAGFAALQPVVEAEEDVYNFVSADNGAGPLWCHNSTCLVRAGAELFASGLETLKEHKPLNNCRWLLFRRGTNGWEQVQADVTGRTREPCPLAGFPDGRLFLSANPTLATAPEAANGPARPEILEFDAGRLAVPYRTLLPEWEGAPELTEHSYRSFAADGPNRELILLQNVGYTHAEWAFRDRLGRWAAQGKLRWPRGDTYEKPQPIRVCYPAVALRNRAVHFCGVSDIIEPRSEWRAFKKTLTGRDWDYEFRRLFYTWTPDIVSNRFHDWIEIASREATCGWITPCDLWAAPDGAVHLLWTERALDERLRDKFFPGARQSHALNHALLREGRIIRRQTLVLAEEGGSREVPGRACFQATADHRLFVFFYVNGKGPAGQAVSEDRAMEVGPDGAAGPAVRVPLRGPFVDFHSAMVRAGSPPSDRLELLGQREGQGQTISYARIRPAGSASP
jgi:hypothetical protein